MFLTAVLVILVAWYLVSYYKWKKNVYDLIEKLPGPRRIPIFGTDYTFLGVATEDLFDAFIQILGKYRPLFRTWNGSNPEIHLTKPNHLELIMGNSTHIKKGHQYRLLYPWLGEGLLTSTGSRWFKHRKLITPAFHFKILENFMEVFVEKTNIFLKLLDAKANGDTHNIYSDITHCALDIICETAMGVPTNAMSDKDNKYIRSVYDITSILIWRTLRPYIPGFVFDRLSRGRRFKEDLEVLHGFSNKVISERKIVLKAKLSEKNIQATNDDEVLGRKKRLSFLDLLLEASDGGKLLSDTDIREEVDTFMFEGHDTTTVGMSWCLILLGNHPEIQEKVFEEVRNVLQGKSTPTSISELHELKYLDCVIKEALRMFPSVPFIMRNVENEVQIDQYTIPAGTQAILHIYGVHRSPELYPEPNKFDPDRFLPENSKGRHPYAYIPFSAGPRNCIGQKFAMYEEKTILASIINRFKVTAQEKLTEVKLSTDLILRPGNGVQLKLERRK